MLKVTSKFQRALLRLIMSPEYHGACLWSGPNRGQEVSEETSKQEETSFNYEI